MQVELTGASDPAENRRGKKKAFDETLIESFCVGVQIIYTRCYSSHTVRYYYQPIKTGPSVVLSLYLDLSSPPRNIFSPATDAPHAFSSSVQHVHNGTSRPVPASCYHCISTSRRIKTAALRLSGAPRNRPIAQDRSIALAILEGFGSSAVVPSSLVEARQLVVEEVLKGLRHQ